MSPAESDRELESMFGKKEWQFQRIITQADLEQKRDIIVLIREVNLYILPGLKLDDIEKLIHDKAIDILLYDEDSKAYYKLKLYFNRPYYFLSDTTEFYENKRLAVGQRLGFRFEPQFAMLTVKLLNSTDD